MTFTLSSDPLVQRIQLNDLLERSQQALARLTAPIPFMDFDILNMSGKTLERKISLYDSRDHVNDYVPPATRFARIGNMRHDSLNMN